MKVGDTVPVHIGPHEVAQAEVKEINGSEAVLIVPARRVVMGIRTELTDLPAPTQQGGQTIIMDDAPSAPVGETPAVDTNTANTQPPAPVAGTADAVAPVQAPQTVETPAEPAPAAPEPAPAAPAVETPPVTPPEN